ncbi:MAG: M15 family metallopeptidase [Potamolinea sp.]
MLSRQKTFITFPGKTFVKLLTAALLLFVTVISPANAATDYSQLVAIPSPINSGMTPTTATYMKSVLGVPGALTTDCSAVTNANLKKLMVLDKDSDVGPFKVTGLKPAVNALKGIFAKVKQDKPELYNQLGTAGMLCVRKVRGGSDFSNHSWGTAIDMKMNGKLDDVGDGKTQLGLKELEPYFRAQKFYWGAGFGGSREDSMHFEASKELMESWKAGGQLKP